MEQRNICAPAAMLAPVDFAYQNWWAPPREARPIAQEAHLLYNSNSRSTYTLVQIIYIYFAERWPTWEFNYSTARSIINELLFHMSLKSSRLSLEKKTAPHNSILYTHTKHPIDHRPVNLHLNYGRALLLIDTWDGVQGSLGLHFNSGGN